jgi:hypothetical protein
VGAHGWGGPGASRGAPRHDAYVAVVN